MKNVLLLLSVFIAINSYAQFGKSVQLMGEGSINGNESIFLTSRQMSQSNGFIGIQVTIDTIAIGSGTGYAIAKAALEESVNVNDFATLNTIENSVYTSQNDTMTINTTSTYLWGISGLPFDYVGAFIQGAVGDTFNYKVYYVGKEY